MRTDDEAFKNAMAIAKRMQQAAGTEPHDDVIMALAILVAFALNDLSKTEQEADAKLQKFVQTIIEVMTAWRKMQKPDA